MTVDIIIPTYKPDEKFLHLIERLLEQSVKIHKIIVMNTEEKYLSNLFFGMRYDKNARCIEIHHISKWQFDHGMTRNKGASYSEADIMIFMTQDAIPTDEDLVKNLIAPLLANDEVKVAYARQVASEDSTLAEKFTRMYNYPEDSCLKDQSDIERLGIKTFFCSNVCAAYKREFFLQQNGFVKTAIFNEDMIYASGVVRSGYKIAYAADACVIHSHNYTNKQQFKRNFDIAVSQKMHPEVFADVSSEAEGKKYVKQAYAYFCEHKKPYFIIPFGVTCVYKYIGFFLGKRYESLSHRMVLKCTMNQRFFKILWHI